MQDRDEEIRKRAYHFWEIEGRPEGRHDDHWHRATREHGQEGGVGGAPQDQARGEAEGQEPFPSMPEEGSKP